MTASPANSPPTPLPADLATPTPLGEPPSPTLPSRVLILKPSSLGDVVSAVPVLRGLRRTFPQARLAWLLAGACMPLLQDDPDLNEPILFDRRGLGRWWRSPAAAAGLWRLGRTLRAGRFDWVIDLQGLLRSGLFGWFAAAPVRAGFADSRERGARWFYTHRIRTRAEHTVDRNIELARRLGIDARSEDFRLHVSPAAARRVADLLGGEGVQPGRFLALAPPTRWPSKLYPLRHWKEVTRQLGGEVPLVLVGSPDDVCLCQQVAQGCPGVTNLAGRTSVADLVALIARSAGVVCSDSAAMFIAPAVGVDVLALVGPTRPGRTGPYGRGSVLVGPVPCQGCLKHRCEHVTCMQLICPTEVASAARAMFLKAVRP